MERLVSFLKEHSLTITSAESLTGGLFASRLVSIPGSSEVFKGSIVSYANDIKRDVLDIDTKIISNFGVVSKEVSELMARHVRPMMASDIAVSFTGNAGPDVLEGKPVGRIYTSIYYLDVVETFEDNLVGSRNEIRNEIIDLSINRVINIVEEGD